MWTVCPKTPLPSSPRRLQREGVTPLRPVAIPADNNPDDAIDPCSKRCQADLEKAAIIGAHPGIPLVYLLSTPIFDSQGADHRLQRAGEPDPHLDRRPGHHGAYPGLGMIGKGVGRSVAKKPDQGDQLACQDTVQPPFHKLSSYRRMGRPNVVGNKSSRKKCTRAMTPTCFPLSLLMGIWASIPSCTYLPNQMTPGLTKPVF
jgi:hypothetical protein